MRGHFLLHIYIEQTYFALTDKGRIDKGLMSKINGRRDIGAEYHNQNMRVYGLYAVMNSGNGTGGHSTWRRIIYHLRRFGILYFVFSISVNTPWKSIFP